MLIVFAFNDVVGYACDDGCAGPVIADIEADYGDEADAGTEPYNGMLIKGTPCMGCGGEVKP